MVFKWITDINADGIPEEHYVPKDGGIKVGGSVSGYLGTFGGLCVWLDGEKNSRDFVHDVTKNGCENLGYTPFTGKTTTVSCKEVLNGTPTFEDKSCKLGGTMFVPSYEQTKLTFEFVGSFTSEQFDNILKEQIFTNSVYKGGYQIFITDNGLLNYQLFNSSNGMVKNITCEIPIKANEVIHIAITDEFGVSGSTKMYINGKEVETIIHQDGTTGVCTSTGTNIGIMGVHSTSAKSVFPVASNGEGCFYGEYTNINSFRIWNRALTPDEIKLNYSIDNTRF